MMDLKIVITAILINFLAYTMIRLRPYFYKTKLFKPMIWNFKLSLIPYGVFFLNCFTFFMIMAVSNYMEAPWLRYVAMLVFAGGMVVWVLLLPNSGYLITELNLTHRSEDDHEVPIWYDIVSVLSFALSGIVNTLANIVIMQLVLIIFYDPQAITHNMQIMMLISALILNLLVSTGIYLGREIRFNSWDVLHPKSFLLKLKKHFAVPGNVKNMILFVFFHTCFFMIMYYAFGAYSAFDALKMTP